MILALDVHYDEPADRAVAAGIAFDDWAAATSTGRFVTRVEGVAPYVPGQFYRRELPCLLALLAEHALRPGCLVVDGFVHLDADGTPGLGQHLFDALGGTTPVVGVAKTSFARTDARFEVRRGASARPLYVTAAGMALDDAKARVAAMHGEHRMPTLLTLVDHACRGRA